LALEAIGNANNERVMLMPLKALDVMGAVAGVAELGKQVGVTRGGDGPWNREA
jgi:hypothetical protein|tara:strand:- start:1807 stop:1965 length:159 start_codon:yes stop_codon:yes gene_type:complete